MTDRVRQFDAHGNEIWYKQWPDSADGDIELGERIWVVDIPGVLGQWDDDGNVIVEPVAEEGHWEMRVTSRPMTDDERAEWHVRNPGPTLVERTGVNAFSGDVDEQVAVSIGLLTSKVTQLERLSAALVEATADPDTVQAIRGQAVAELQVIDNDPQMREDLIVHEATQMRAIATAWLATSEGQAWLAAALGGA